MINYNYSVLLKKMLLSVFSIFVIATLTFFLFEMIPGDIYNVDSIKNENVINNIIIKYGLNESIVKRYIKMLVNIVNLDFGNSFVNGRSVNEIICTHFPVSLKVGCIAFTISIINGIIISVIINKYRTRFISHFFIAILVVLYSLPTFEIAALLQYFVCVKLKIFPVISEDNLSKMVLPILILSFSPTTFIARLLYKKLREEEKKDYVLAAQLRGITTINVFLFYSLKNSLSSVITAIGPIFTNLIVGSFTIELIFSIRGLGRYFITSITNRDYPLVMGLTVFYSFLVVMINIISEVLMILNNRGRFTHENIK